MRRRREGSGVRLGAVVFALATAPAAAQTEDAGGTASIVLGDVIVLRSEHTRVLEPLERAVAMWRGCPQFAVGFPRLATTDDSPDAELRPGEQGRLYVTVTIDERPGRRLRCGAFEGRSIVLHRDALDGRGRLFYCGALAQNLAHEIGHLLGVRHARPPERASDPVMTPKIAQAVHRADRISPSECAAADRRWMTSRELGRARALGLAAPEHDFGRPLLEVATEWHQVADGTRSAEAQR
jgi:hypothetical protein